MAVESFTYSPEVSVRRIGLDTQELSFTGVQQNSSYDDINVERALAVARVDIQAEGSIFPAMGFTYEVTDGRTVVNAPTTDKLNRLSRVTGYDDGRSFVYASSATTSSRDYIGSLAKNEVTISPDPNFMLHDIMFHNFLFLPPRALKVIRDESSAALASDNQDRIDALTGTIDGLTGGETDAAMLSRIYRRQMGPVAASLLAFKDMRKVNSAKREVMRRHRKS